MFYVGARSEARTASAECVPFTLCGSLFNKHSLLVIASSPRPRFESRKSRRVSKPETLRALEYYSLLLLLAEAGGEDVEGRQLMELVAAPGALLQPFPFRSVYRQRSPFCPLELDVDAFQEPCLEVMK